MLYTTVAEWFNENLAWVIGLPLGAIFTAFLEIINQGRKTKQYIEQIKSTKLTLKSVQEQTTLAKDITTKTRDLANACKDAIEYIDTRLNGTDELVKKLVVTFNQLNDTLSNVEKRLVDLERVQAILASSNEEYVKSGKAIEVNKIVNE